MNKVIPYFGPCDDQNLALLTRQIRESLLRELERELAAIGLDLNYSSYVVLNLLAKFGSQKPGELARWTNYNAGAMSRIVDQLEDKGYVRRQLHAQDRRALQIELTVPGRALWKSMSACYERVQRAAFVDLKETERDKLFALLARVRDTLEKSK